MLRLLIYLLLAFLKVSIFILILIIFWKFWLHEYFGIFNTSIQILLIFQCLINVIFWILKIWILKLLILKTNIFLLKQLSITIIRSIIKRVVNTFTIQRFCVIQNVIIILQFQSLNFIGSILWFNAQTVFFCNLILKKLNVSILRYAFAHFRCRLYRAQIVICLSCFQLLFFYHHLQLQLFNLKILQLYYFL